jgi:hypothetical protein
MALKASIRYDITIGNHHVIAVTVTHATTEELWEAVFSVGSAQSLYTGNQIGTLRSSEDEDKPRAMRDEKG